MTSFEIGKTYFARSVCDYDCIIQVKVVKRTAKTITTSDNKTLRVSVWDNCERVMPWGRYSMAPVVTAEKILH